MTLKSAHIYNIWSVVSNDNQRKAYKSWQMTKTTLQSMHFIECPWPCPSALYLFSINSFGVYVCVGDLSLSKWLNCDRNVFMTLYWHQSDEDHHEFNRMQYAFNIDSYIKIVSTKISILSQPQPYSIVQWCIHAQNDYRLVLLMFAFIFIY